MKRAVLVADQLGKRPVYLTELEPEIAHLFQVEPVGPLLKVTEGPDLTEARRELEEEAEEAAEKEATEGSDATRRARVEPGPHTRVPGPIPMTRRGPTTCALSLKALVLPADIAR